ncbi:MAG: hypothetical protein JO102_02810, partial [Elusimicrobia bacterium]|nr:hypothetical protein [Elusimicrobiota bacterium]
TGRIGSFAKRIYVALAIDESPKRSIAFQDFSRRSFDRYAGSWTIEPGKDGLTVVYELEAEPRFFVPSFIAGPAFRDSVQVLLAQVREEILRRARSPGNS